jgi:hypothetical protein
MRCSFFITNMLLVGCAPTLSVTAHSPERTCDPKGPEPFFGLVAQEKPVQETLSESQNAARGTCSDASKREPGPQMTEGFLATIDQDPASLFQCNGVCEPMRARLSIISEQHDLSEVTVQRECTSAVAVVAKKVRGVCQEVCVAERWRGVGRKNYARTLRALLQLVPDQQLPTPRARSQEELEQILKASGISKPMPPIAFRFEATAATAGMTLPIAEGLLFPGGPVVHLRIAKVDEGCGLSHWGIEAR